MRYLTIILMFLISTPSQALQLFGVTLNNINRVQLREVIRNSGAEVVREAGDDNWYDVYNMSENFKPSKQMFVAYDKASGNFAFIEYHLPYGYNKTMLKRLQLKYGKPKIQYGNYASDAKYLWSVEGIDISLQQDWGGSISRLVYSQKDNLALLNQSYQQENEAKVLKKLQQNGKYF